MLGIQSLQILDAGDRILMQFWRAVGGLKEGKELGREGSCSDIIEDYTNLRFHKYRSNKDRTPR